MFPGGFWYTYGTNGTVTVPTTQVTPGFPVDWITGIDWAIPMKQGKVQRGNAEGYECDECKDFYPMAELNMPENAKEHLSFRCYSCRKGLRTVFGKIGT